MTLRRYALFTHRGGYPVDRGGVPQLVILNLDDSDPERLAWAYDLLNRYLISAAKTHGARPDEMYQYQFVAYAVDDQGRSTGRELFRWALPEPPEETSR